jgi:hypothetical protein
LGNQAKTIFQDENSTPTNQQINKPNKSWIKTRFTFVVTFVALGV